MSTSSGPTPAWANARGPQMAAAVEVEYGISLTCQWVWAPEAPST